MSFVWAQFSPAHFVQYLTNNRTNLGFQIFNSPRIIGKKILWAHKKIQKAINNKISLSNSHRRKEIFARLEIFQRYQNGSYNVVCYTIFSVPNFYLFHIVNLKRIFILLKSNKFLVWAQFLYCRWWFSKNQTFQGVAFWRTTEMTHWEESD